MLKHSLLLLFVFVLKTTVSQTTYTWTGATSTSWTVSTNWTPNGVPTSTDNVKIVTGSNNCIIDANKSVNNFTLTSGTLNLMTYSFTVNGNATLLTGTVSGASATLDCEGSTTTFGNTTAGPVINAAVMVNALTITSQRTTFNNSVSITKLAAGSSSDNWRGGNTFNSSFYLNCASTFTTDNVGDIYIGSNNGDPTDIFNGRSTFYITGCARIRIPQNGTAVFNGIAAFYSNGYGTVHDRMQPARQGNAAVTFNDSTYFYCNSSTTDVQIAYDATTKATFNGPVVATHYGSSAAEFMFGNDGKVLFNDNLTLNCLGSGAITITNGLGTSTLSATKSINIGSLGFSSGRLDIRSFTQLGTTPQSITLTGTTSTLNIGSSGKPSVFNGDVTFAAPRVSLLASTFNGNSSFTKNGATNDDCGGNTFGGIVNITNNSAAEFRFASLITGDTYASNVNLTNTTTGIISMSRTYYTTYADNISIVNTNTVSGGGMIFGDNGGTSVLAGSKTISVGGGGYTNGYLFLFRFNQAVATTQNINLSGTSTTLRMGVQTNTVSGCNFPGDFTASAKAIDLTGNTFGGTTLFNQSGTGTTRAWGGNTFVGPHTINVSNVAGIQCSQLVAAETYSSTVDVNLTGSGGVTLARTYNTTFPENITITSTSSGAIAFGFNGGASTLANGKTLSIGGLGYTGTNLYLYKFNQIGSTPQSFVLTGAASEMLIGAITPSTYGCNFGGNLTVSAPNFVITSSTFNGNTSFVKTGGDDDDNNGNNTFNGTLSFANTCTTSAVFVRMANIFGADTYNGASTFSTSCPTGGFVLARTFNGSFNENVICNSTGGYIYFGAGSTLTGIGTLAANKTITCGTFSSGLLSFRRFNQLSNTAQTINTTGTANIEYGGNSTNTSTFSNFEGDLTTSSANYIAITNSIFQRNATFTAKYYLNLVTSTFNQVSGSTSLSRVAGTSSDDLGGGNTVNGDFTFSNSGSGRHRMGVTAYGGDIFNGNVTITNSGTGTLSFAYNNGTNTIAGNLNLSSSSTGSTIFGEAATSNATTLSGIISATSGNYTNGTINLRYLTQSTGSNTVTGTSSAVAFSISNGTINGDLNVATVGSTSLLSSIFNSTVAVTSTGSTAFTSSIFNSIATLTNSGTTSFATSTFNGNTTLNNTNTTTIRTSTLNAVNNFTSTAFVLGGTLAQGNTFNTGTTIFTKNGTTNDDVNGGNIFNAPVVFNTTNATGRWRLGVTSADDFNGDVTFNQQNAGTLAPAYDANSTFAGNITMSAPTGSVITFASGTGRATMDGGNSQTISKTGGNDPNFSRLTLNKSANDITLNTRINIVTDFTLTAGVLNTTSTNILNMNNAATTNIGNATSYVNGPMNYDMALNGTRTLNMPIGKGADWRPVALTLKHNAATSFTYKSEVTNANAMALGYTKPATVDSISKVHYWDITRSTTSTGVVTPTTSLNGNQTITLYYGVNDFVTDPAYLTIVKNTYTAGTTWIDIGGTGATAWTGSVTSTSSPSAFSSFSRFTLANKIGGTNPLPIELLSFTAQPVNKTVSLDWATASEVNNSHYDIERSADGVHFEYVTTVKAYGNGNSLNKQTYNAIDNAPYKGISYYRLKQVDKNGSFNYAKVVSVEFVSESYVNVFPNPASGVLMIKTSDDYSNASVKIINSIGMDVISDAQISSYNGKINISHLAAGIYYVVIANGDKPENIKISIQ